MSSKMTYQFQEQFAFSYKSRRRGRNKWYKSFCNHYAVYMILAPKPTMYHLPYYFYYKTDTHKKEGDEELRRQIMTQPLKPHWRPIKNITILRHVIVPKTSILIIRLRKRLLLHLQKCLQLTPPIITRTTRL